jgi:hypothetical protein
LGDRVVVISRESARIRSGRRAAVDPAGPRCADSGRC